MNNSSPQLYLLTGNDENQISVEAENLFQQLAGPDPDPFACDIIQETDAGPAPELIHSLITSIQSPPFMGGTKLIRLKHFTGFAGEGDQKTTSPMGTALKALARLIAEGLPQDVILMMDGAGCDGRKALAKACSSKGKVLQFNKPVANKKNWREDMAGCIQRVAEQKKVSLSPAAREMLIDILGAETANIETELEKIICYCGGPDKPITPEDIRQICVGMSEEQNWALNDCLGQRNLNKVISMTEQLLSQSKTPEATARSLIMTVTGFFRQALQIKILMREEKLKAPNQLYQLISNTPPAEKKKYGGYASVILSMHPYRAQMLAEQSGRYSPGEIIQALKLLRDALWQTTSSNTSPCVALENALYQIIGVPVGPYR